MFLAVQIQQYLKRFTVSKFITSFNAIYQGRADHLMSNEFVEHSTQPGTSDIGTHFSCSAALHMFGDI